MEMSLKVNGLEGLNRALKGASQAVKGEVGNAVKMIVATLERGGKEAVRSGPTRAFDTGNLMNNIGSVYDQFSGIIFSEAPYSLYIHEGTKYMKERPFFEKAIEDSQESIQNIIEDSLNRIFN